MARGRLHDLRPVAELAHGVGPGAARERVRVARALGELPVLSAALGAGELSYSVARALTRVATPVNESELVETARHSTAADLERLVRAWRRAERSEAAERAAERARHARRELWLIPAADGSWRIWGRLDPEAGAALQRALEAAGEALYGRAAADPETPPEARRADALGLAAEAALGEGLGAAGAKEPEAGAKEAEEGPKVVGRAERFQVVVHVSAETLAAAGVGGDGVRPGDGAGPGNGTGPGGGAGPPDPPRIERGPHVSAETARRLACDAGLVTMSHERDGTVRSVGRRRRTVPAALRRALDHRDGGCRFPGCRARYCDAHHVQPWAEGDETRLGTSCCSAAATTGACTRTGGG